MAPAPVRLALRRTLTQVRHVRPVHPCRATGRVAAVYQQVERDFGMLAPPVALHSPAPGPLAACWTMLRETLLAGNSTSRAAREIVAAGISAGNTCPYCVEVHTAALAGAAGRNGPTGGPEPGEIASWIRGTAESALSARDAYVELVGVAVAFEYLNRMVNVLLAESPLPPGLPPSVRRNAHGVLGRVLRPAGSGSLRGDSLDLLPSAGLPEDLRWAGEDAVISAAFARASAEIEDAGRRSLPDSVRTTVLQQLSEWDGQPPGLGRDWLEDVACMVPGEERPALRLAMLTAMASYQVADSTVAEFRRDRPADRTLIEAVAWASLAAARRRGVLLTSTARKEKTTPLLSKENGDRSSGH